MARKLSSDDYCHRFECSNRIPKSRRILAWPSNGYCSSYCEHMDRLN